jgi:aspartyl-tRNA(Asn)/glutamyl-tRNA(Gln) amidotransferase subunit B
LEAEAARLISEADGFPHVLEAAVAAGADARTVANWLTGEVVAHLRRIDSALLDVPLTGEHLADLNRMVQGGELSATAAKQVLAGVLEGEGDPRRVAEARDLMQIADAGELEAAVDEALAAHPEELARLRSGDDKLVGFFVGRIMQATGGKADPRKVTELIRARASG